MERLLTPVFLLGEVHGQRSLAGYSPGDAESDTTERISLSLQFQVENKIGRKVQKFPMCSLPPQKHVLPHFNIQPILKLDKLISVTEMKKEFRFSPNPVLFSFSSLCWMSEPPPSISQLSQRGDEELRVDSCLKWDQWVQLLILWRALLSIALLFEENFCNSSLIVFDFYSFCHF